MVWYKGYRLKLEKERGTCKQGDTGVEGDNGSLRHRDLETGSSLVRGRRGPLCVGREGVSRIGFGK